MILAAGALIWMCQPSSLTRLESGSIGRPGLRQVESDAARTLPMHVFELGIRNRVVNDHDGARLGSERRDGVQCDPVVDPIGRGRHDNIAAGADSLLKGAVILDQSISWA